MGGDPGKSIKSISTKLQFDIPAGSQAESAILEAESTIIAASEDLDLHVHHFSSFGKEVCKRLGMSPDAFVQMGLQLAYYRDSGGKFVQGQCRGNELSTVYRSFGPSFAGHGRAV